ncbi:hypothetical protein XA68_16871 [Ophiocordyceps unilateralis]|uniref:Uncharacterized protein n=1 Tax=Ophiocordyceps unilateralis TaxID=268505 RepID=A0A2A9PL52_OPHUN|nr:hypothetical protein XA68_16871 [Ophiocordyceps unilateralis]
MGTVLWCLEQWSQERFTNAAECEAAREQLTPTEWRFVRMGCSLNNEDCSGTDYYCEKLQNLSQRIECFQGRKKAPWLEPNSDGCIVSVDWDERCHGSQAWCETERMIESYGSSQTCLGFRQPRAAPRKSPFKSPLVVCIGDNDQTEDCMGTEVFCNRLNNSDQALACVQSRSKPWFAVPYSATCDGILANLHHEGCRGTDDWCRSQDSIRLYGSEAACRSFRRGDKPNGLLWRPPVTNCTAKDEHCLGTDTACGKLQYPNLIAACYSAREKPPFSRRNSEDCFKLGLDGEAYWDDERCVGTVFWCQKRWSPKFESEAACRSHRILPYAFNGRKVPWVQTSNSFDLCPVSSEECMGTEEYCGSLLDNERVMQCYEQRELMPFFPRNHPECRGKMFPNRFETCRGTKEWCDDAMILQRFYGGRTENCLKFREKNTLEEAQLPWQYGSGSNKCYDGDEECLGTEAFCVQTGKLHGVKACLEKRKRPPLLEPDSTQCPPAEKGRDQRRPAKKERDERCMGSEAWCLAWDFIYGNYPDCIAHRGLNLVSYRETIEKMLVPRVSEAVLKGATNVTANGALLQIVVRNGSVADARTTAEADRKLFLDEIEKRLEAMVVNGIDRALK